MTKVFVLGNCQVGGIADALRLLKPGVKLERYVVTHEGKSLVSDLKNFRNRDFDVAIVHESVSASLADQSGLVEQLAPRVLKLPSLTFSAFHPDIVYAFHNNQVVKNGLNSDWNSRIILLSYLEGFSEKDTLSLFNSTVFDSLGYFTVWSSSASELAESFARCDLDFSRWIRRVQRQGVFMYGINHPAQFALCELAAQIAEGIDNQPSDVVADLPRLTKDYLAHIVWPVYPEIAKRLGLDGSYHWRVGDDFANLDQFVERCYWSWNKARITSLSLNFVPTVSPETIKTLQSSLS